MDDWYATLPSKMKVLETTESDIITPHRAGAAGEEREKVRNGIFKCFPLKPPKRHWTVSTAPATTEP